MFVFESRVSSFYVFRLLGFLRYVHLLKMSNQLKIFLKTGISFTSYMLPYLIILGSFVLIANCIALEVFRREAYIGELSEGSVVDIYVLYSITSLRIFLISDWSSVRFV